MRHTLEQLKTGCGQLVDPPKERSRDHHLQGRARHRRHHVDFAIPGIGLVPINAFVLHGAEPVLVDTGPVVESDEFMAALRR